MQKLQPELDQWPASLIRARSGNSRDNKKVSCETLSKVDWYSRRPHEAQLYYRSDTDEEENPTSDAEDEHEARYGEDDKEQNRFVDKVENHGYGDGFSAQGHHFLACFHLKAAPTTSISSPGRDAKKTERAPRTYPSPIPHSGSLLPHSGRLVPHSGPLKLHVGSHAMSHANGKVSGSVRGSTLIPLNIAGKSSKSSGFGNANEPSSPKVTCLGRVKIKQKYCRDMGRLADMAPNDKARKSIADQMMKLKRRKNKAHAAEEVAVPTEDSAQKPVRNEEEKKAGKAGMSSSARPVAELKKSSHGYWGSHEEDISSADATSDSERKGQKGKWRFKEPGVRMKFHSSDKKKSSHPLDVSDTELSSSQADCSIDLNRFRATEWPHVQDNRLSKSLASLSIGDECEKVEPMDEAQFVPQVPPPNSLLLMRNSKSRGVCATLAASSTARRHSTGTSEEAVEVNRQVHVSASKEESLAQLTSVLMGVDMNEREIATKVNGDEQTASLADTKVKKLGAVVPAECTRLQVKTKALAFRHTSFPKTPSEAASLWQRRHIVKPSMLDVGKPLTLQVKEPTTR